MVLVLLIKVNLGLYGIIWDYGLSVINSYPSYWSWEAAWYSSDVSTLASKYNQYHLLTVIVNENNTSNPITTYLDGVKISGLIKSNNSSSISSHAYGFINQSDYPLIIGAGQPGVYFKGYMDDIRIYNRALSADEVQALYSGSTTTPVVNNPAINSTVANNLDVQLPEMLMEDEQGNTNRLASNLRFIGNDSDGLPQWELQHYEMLPKTGVVISQNIPRVLSNYDINIPLVQNSVSKEVYWANLGFTGKPNSKLSWKLKEYGISDKNSPIPAPLPSNGTTSTTLKVTGSAPGSDLFLFGVDLVGNFTENNLPQLFQLSRDLSIAEEALLVAEKGNFADLSKIKAAKEAASLLKQVIKTAQEDINAGKVANINNGNINISSSISRLVTGVQVIASLYNTYDILNKTINGTATAADKEKYIINGAFSVFGLTSVISTPAVASGVVMKAAGLIGLGYAALQIGAAWGESYNGITVTGTIKDAVQKTLFNVQALDNIARNILEGASKGKTWEEMKALEAITTAGKSVINVGLTSIETLENWNSKFSIIFTSNVIYANNAKVLISDTMKMVNSEQYSLTTYQNLYNAGRQAYYANQALIMLHEK